MPDRREILAGLLAMSAPAVAAEADPFSPIEAALSGGRIGVAILNLANGRSARRRAKERFALCSTFKLPLVAAVHRALDTKRLNPDTRVPVGSEAANVLAPSMKALLPDGSASIHDLCAATMVYSDNAAANLLLPLVGGPAGLTDFMRDHKGGSMRLDRTEPTLNTNLPGDPRDTTTPADMLSLMQSLLLGSALAPASRAQLIAWMVASKTGAQRLRSGLPAQWRVGDKTGTGERGAANDISIAWPTRSVRPILIAAYVDAPQASPDQRNAAHRAIARVAASLL
jgi:beta-lactamase class A